jgi:CRP/FNR family transcriptional regulator, cyclic AMP receptor protein
MEFENGSGHGVFPLCSRFNHKSAFFNLARHCRFKLVGRHVAPARVVGPHVFLFHTYFANSFIERFAVPTLLNAAGEPLKWLRLVVDGHIAFVARRASGKEVAITDVVRGNWATWLPCFVETPPDYDFYSGASSCFIAFPISGIRAFCSSHPEIYPPIIAEIGLRMRLLMEWTGQSVLVGAEQRMAKLIHLLCREQKIQGNAGILQVNHVRLAGLARCSRQSANSLLGSLEKLGLVSLAYGKIEIKDLDRLAAFAEEERDD